VRVLTLILDVIPDDGVAVHGEKEEEKKEGEEEKKKEVALGVLKVDEQLNPKAPEMIRDIHGLLIRGEAGGLVRSILARQMTSRLVRALAQY
jgi:hypothetical protein